MLFSWFNYNKDYKDAAALMKRAGGGIDFLIGEGVFGRICRISVSGFHREEKEGEKIVDCSSAARVWKKLLVRRCTLALSETRRFLMPEEFGLKSTRICAMMMFNISDKTDAVLVDLQALCRVPGMKAMHVVSLQQRLE